MYIWCGISFRGMSRGACLFWFLYNGNCYIRDGFGDDVKVVALETLRRSVAEETKAMRLVYGE